MLICDSICIRIISRNQIIVAVGNELLLCETNNKPQVLPAKLTGKIHEIAPGNNGQLLISGEKEFMILDLRGSDCRELCRHSITDWISSAKFLANDEFCLVTAHSVALRLRLDESVRSAQIVRKSSCEDKSTLYCSHLVGETFDDLLVFGGNAFGEILVWKPSKHSTDTNRSPLLHRIPGHQGVIFSINVDFASQLMVTTSDDRSVRFWTAVQEADELSFTSYKSAYGHAARVFQGKIIKEGSDRFVVSAGEDSFICLWSQDGELIFKRRHHFGATIWNLDYDEETKTLVSCGSDGSSFKFSLEDAFKPKSVVELLTSGFESGEYLAKIKFLGSDYLIGITSRNRLASRRATGEFEFVHGFTGGSKCTVLQIHGNSVALAGYKFVCLFECDEERGSFRKMFEGEVLDGMIRTFCFLGKDEFLLCDESGQCKIFADNFTNSWDVELPKSKDQWVTTGFKLDNFVVLSNRQGSLLLYVLEKNVYTLETVVKRVHGNLGVTSFILESNSQKSFLIRTTGHDNSIKTLLIDKLAKSMKIMSRECVPISWIEKFDGRHLIGFNDNHLVLWERHSDVLLEVPCGGGHRCWDAQIDTDRNRISVVFIKNRKTFEHVAPLRNVSKNCIVLPRHFWHIKPCNVLRLVRLSASELLLVSGGEENLVKLSVYDGQSLVLKREIFSHISSVKTIKIVQSTDRHKFLLFSAGGRAQICVTEFDAQTLTLDEKLNFMLKASDFNRKFIRNPQDIDFDPETRFMSLDVREAATGNFELFAGCSDGYMRKFAYKSDSETLELRQEIFYSRCLLHVRLLEGWLVTAATDGIVSFWDSKDLSLPIFKVKHHDNGINSWDMKRRDDEILIVTGGDDQSVVVSKLKFANLNFTVLSTRKIESLHTAQVNGVRIANDLGHFFSIGVDQQLLKVDLTTLAVESSFFSCIADVKGLEMAEAVEGDERQQMCFVYGCGLQVITL